MGDDELTIGTADTPEGECRRIVVVPSRSLDRWHEPLAERQAYEERLLTFLFELRDPRLEITYVSSLPIASSTIDYHLSMLPASSRASARSRLDLVAVGDGGARPLSEKLLRHRSALDRLRHTIRPSQQAALVPYNSTDAERELGLALRIPVYGADPRHAELGTKSGARRVFAEAGVSHPAGAERLRTVGEVAQAIGSLREARPELGQLLVKLDRGVSGEGNAIVDLAGLPESGGPPAQRLIEGRVRGLVPEADAVTPEQFLIKLAVQGGVVEERITGPELRSPSVQLNITPVGRVQVLATHDQILGGRTGQQYVGCRFPADPAYVLAITERARRVAERMAAIGVIGRFAIDFVVARRHGRQWDPFAVEINLRMGGTTHPQQTLTCLTGGAYDAEGGTFSTRRGEPRHYVSSDHLKTPGLDRLGASGVAALAAFGRLLWDPRRGSGAVFHMLGSLERLGRVGVTTIAETPEQADALYSAAEAAVSRTPRADRDASERRRRSAA